MEREELVYSGRWSRGYKKGSVFIKELVYYEPASLEREAKASSQAYHARLKTPQYISSSNNGSTLRLFFEWVTMRPIQSEQASLILDTLLATTEALQRIKWSSHDYYWEDILLKDFSDALSYVEDETEEYRFLLNRLEPSVFIHGDLSLQNIGLARGNLYLYDFQHGCLGPRNWDRYYLAATLAPKLTYFTNLSKQEARIVCAIAAIKLGRAIRKDSPDVKAKEILYQQWKKTINIQ